MSRADDLVPLLTRQPGDCTLLTGRVVSWSEGSFVVRLRGVRLSGLPVLSSVGTLAAGDTVAVLRQQSSYLIIGKTVPAGS